MKHTPGPWKLEKTSSGSFWVQKGIAHSIALIGHENAEADANLIAAAPELVVAIQFALDEFSSKECNCDGAPDANYACYFHRIEGDLRRALAKATGGAG